MSITAERKQEVIKEHAKKSGDTGSTEVQVAILTERITNLTQHFKGSDTVKGNAKDHQSRRGLLILVGRRRRLLDYLKRTEADRYEAIIAKLKLRK